MCENTEIADQMIPSFVGQYRRKVGERIPEIIVIDIDSNMSKMEKHLFDFFKCSKNWDLNNENQPIGNTSSLYQTETALKKQCFASRHTILAFQTHIEEKHPTDQLFCIYCWHLMDNRYSSMSNLKTYSHNYLIKHMMKKHRFRRFQCNFCLYRAITEDHVIIHQKVCHEKEYFNATFGNSVTKSDEICQIFVTPKITEEVKTLYYYWRKFKALRFNCNGNNEALYQCLYCSFMNDQLVKVIQHIVQRHPDYALLYFIPEQQISSSTITRLVSDWNSYELIANFRPKRPKIEPQDNSISSTQKSPDISCQTIAEQNINLFETNLDAEEVQSGSKRPEIDSTQTNCTIDQNIVQPVEPMFVQKYFICLFCKKKKFKETEASKKHLESHLKLDSLVDRNYLQLINWIQTFVSKQWQLCSFVDCVEPNPVKAYYRCPLCVRLGKHHNRIPKNYETFGEFRYHLWQHSCWLSIKCKQCQSSIPNCDPIVCQHFRENHESVLRINKYSFLNEDKPFTAQQKELLQKKYIEDNGNEKIEKSINQLMIKTKEKNEQNWRDIKQNEEKAKYNRVRDMLPKVTLEPLSTEDLDKYLREYKEYEINKIKKSVNMSETEKTAAILLIDSKPDEQNPKKKKKNKKDKHSKEKESKKSKKNKGVDSGQTHTDTVNLESCVGTSGQSCSYLPQPEQHMANIFQTSVNSEPNLDKELEEDSHRIVCYHCNERFKKKIDCKRHSEVKHPNQVLRMFSKPVRPKPQ